MSGKRWKLWAAWAALVLAAALAAPAFPGPDGEPPPAAPSGPPVGSDDAASAPPAAAADVEASQQATVERILREQDAALRGQLFSYEPLGRRDPFQSLMTAKVFEGQRPSGVAGMLVTELDLTGVVRDPRGGNVAMVMGSDNRAYFLHVGDLVFDGTLITIDPYQGAVTFRQQVDDPRLIKPYRDVVKRLVPLEESSDE